MTVALDAADGVSTGSGSDRVSQRDPISSFRQTVSFDRYDGDTTDFFCRCSHQLRYSSAPFFLARHSRAKKHISLNSAEVDNNRLKGRGLGPRLVSRGSANLADIDY